jgi:hypothetical protein
MNTLQRMAIEYPKAADAWSNAVYGSAEFPMKEKPLDVFNSENQTL